MTKDSKELSFFVAGICVPKARPRVTRIGAYTEPKTKRWEREVSVCAGSAMFPRKPLTGPLMVGLSFALKDGRSMRADIDNLAKSVLDGMNGKIYKDDAQVVRLFAYKFLAKDCACGVNVTIREDEK